MQYAAAGVPFIASATAEYLELSAAGVGHVADTVTSWRKQLTWLLTGLPEWRRRHGREARDIAFKMYGLEATGRRYDDLFSSLL